MFDKIIDFLNNNFWVKFAIDAYLIFIVVFLVFLIILKNRKMIGLIFSIILFYLVSYAAYKVGLPISSKLYPYLSMLLTVGVIVVFSSDIKKMLETRYANEKLPEIFEFTKEKDNKELVDAITYLSAHKTGALITLEKHNSLDQYADKAIPLNAVITKELLINIFYPNTPLHDGAVIIRGNKIRCAGAYYVLAENEDIDKTTGSRHRAALGISEVSDALTLIVSEETGNVSIALNGIMVKVNSKEAILEYLESFSK